VNVFLICTEFTFCLCNPAFNLFVYLFVRMGAFRGGVDILKPVLGKDATSLFEKYHRWVNIDGLIGPLLLGYLAKETHQDHNDIETDYLLPNAIQPTSNDFEFQPPPPRSAKKVPSLLKASDIDDQDSNSDLDPWE